jgi:Xaa-Pro aminopeptidase
MFPKEVYIQRRANLKGLVGSGLALFLGNNESPMNYPSNSYRFRQDSSFLYFFGINLPDLAGLIDLDSGEAMLFGNDADIEDIIWSGTKPSLQDNALETGITLTYTLKTLSGVVSEALKKGRRVNFLPPFRAESLIQLGKLLDKSYNDIPHLASKELMQAVIVLRSVKDQYEIKDMEDTLSSVTYQMYKSILDLARPGVSEGIIAGHIEGISLSNGGQPAYPIILSKHGETLHNHGHNNILEKGDLLLIDAGAESALGYATDITRTYPVGGKFTSFQKEIYEIVLKTQLTAIKAIQPGVKYRDVHLLAARVIADGLKDLGLMKGNMSDAVHEGAHALFFPHGIGHMLGLDVHDMEGLGEDNVGYDDENKRSEQFGLAYLRMAKKLRPGYVITVEPGIYFINELIDLWKNEGKFTSFINYEKVDKYRNFGGIRIEDNILVTPDGHKVLGNPIPKTVEEIEKLMS